MRIERLTETEYGRLNTAIESSLPRVGVGEVALAIVNERCDALAMKVADAGERIALAIEAQIIPLQGSKPESPKRRANVEAAVEDIRRITYNADDIIVLRAKSHLSKQAMDRIQDQIGRQFEGRKVIVLDAGMTLDVMAPDESNDTGVTLTPGSGSDRNVAPLSATPDDGDTP